MSKRTLRVVLGLGMLLVVAPVVSAQTDDISDLTGKATFSADEQDRLQKAIDGVLDRVVAGTDNRLVDAARKQLIDMVQSSRSTEEFKALAAKLIVKQATAKMANPILVYKNRLALAIVIAQMQEPDSVSLLLRLLGGEGPEGERYAGVRYWAAKGLAGKAVSEAIVQGRAPEPMRKVLADLEKVLMREKDGICVGAMLEAVAALGTDAATDVMIRAAADKARTLNLGNRDAAESMRAAVVILEGVYRNDIRPISEVKQPIVGVMAQILAQTPPHGDGLTLIAAINEALGRLTGETTGLGEAVAKCRDQANRLEPKVIDGVWLEQLNWIETLLRLDKQGKKELRLKQRPVLLDWSPAKSAEVAAKSVNR
ncbi:MAG: hypothetical protein JXL80_00450 [Planctomycetes bacterium]|nr:hypothetical protein [Planctomycetota bacterium]